MVKESKNELVNDGQSVMSKKSDKTNNMNKTKSSKKDLGEIFTFHVIIHINAIASSLWKI